MFRITETWIREFQSGNGGWTRDQLDAVGVAWPPREGWIGRLVGKEITDEQRERFERRRDRHMVRREMLGNDMFG